ncbi:MAG: putative membrane protein [Paraglaciecola sp.]|jgi:uncharacterized membrane protein
MVNACTRVNESIITLSPNRSANWLQTKILIVSIGLFVLLIALAWSVAGVWMILPFAGFEVSLLAFLLYRVSYSSYQKQLITIDSQHVRFEAGVYFPKQSRSFTRDAAKLAIIEPQGPYGLTKISLGDKNSIVELGCFLNQDDRKIALRYLKEAGLRVHSNKWWLAN